MNKHILLVEDDPNLGFVIQDNLQLHGYQVTWCKDGEAGLTTFFQGTFNICVLDVMLPKKDGFALAREIRQGDKEIPILFLTAKSMIDDRLTGFRSGGDDYIMKPFSLEELLCRIEVFLRRSRETSHTTVRGCYTIGTYEFDFENLRLRHANHEKKLTQKEADVLRLLYLNCDRILKREEILNQVWGDDDYFMGRSMDVFISKLRKYLKDDASIKITNYHGVGFRLEIKKHSAL